VKLGLTAKVFIGLAAGIAVGLFIGERAASLQVWADAYIKLLQMTVLPYVAMSLIGGLGSLTRQEAARLGSRVGLLLLGFSVVALAAVFLFPLMFPPIQSASFFSTTLLEDTPPLDLIGLYIPANPFYALANNVVPAVVLFSALLGVALIGVRDKQIALGVIAVLNNALEGVARFIVSLTPYGLFAIAAVVAGTFDPEQAAKLQVYLLAYVAIALLLTFWVLPGLVAALTPIPHRAVLSCTRDALVMAFTTGSLFVVLPLLVEKSRQLLRTYAALPGEDERLPEVIIPAAYNFPHTAKIMSLSFVLFAAWFSGAPLPLKDYPALGTTGILTLFGSLNVAVPFLLDMFHVPADTFQLFLATSVVNARFGTLLSAVHTIAVALIGACAAGGALRFDAGKLLRFALTTAMFVVATVGGTHLVAERFAGSGYDRDKVLAGMHAIRNRGEAHVFDSAAPALPPLTGSVLDRIRSRKLVRVGYFEDSLPYAFTNSAGELVGLDVEMAYQLARDLGVGLELVPVSRTLFSQGLDPALCDLVMSGAVVTADRALHVLYSTPYLDETLAFIVADYRRAEFATWDDVVAQGKLRLGVPGASYYVDNIRARVPMAQLSVFTDVQSMFAQSGQLDAFILTAERGSAYTLLHPEYSVVVPKPQPIKVPLAYVIAGRDGPLATVIDTWIDLKKKDGTIDELFAHWIQGRNAVPHVRRWSVMDDVLHW
jgi:Na+/H+-dicarboxylate symporter